MNLVETDIGHVKGALDSMGWYLSIPFMLIAVLGYLITMIGWPLLATGVVAIIKIRFDLYLAESNK